jgi:hypothetical protein
MTLYYFQIMLECARKVVFARISGKATYKSTFNYFPIGPSFHRPGDSASSSDSSSDHSDWTSEENDLYD